MLQKSKKLVPTILGKLDQNTILRIKNDNWEGYVSPFKNDAFYKINHNNYNVINTKEMIHAKLNDFLTPVKFKNIIGIGKNFCKKNKLNSLNTFKLNPDFFVMNKSALQKNNQITSLPYYYDSALVEAEIGVVIKRKCKNLDIKEVKNYIAGYLICNDLSGRDLKSLNTDNTLLRKSSDGFLPVSSALMTGYKSGNFILKTFINNELVQIFNTKDLILQIDDIISFLSKFITLNKNDLICTGSAIPKPKVKSGDKVKISVEGMGDLITDIR